MYSHQGHQASSVDVSQDAEQAEMTRLVFQGLMPALVLSGIALVGITGLLAHEYHDAVLWQLAAVAALFWLARMGLCVVIAKSATTGMPSGATYRYEHIYAYVTVVYNCTLAAASVHNFRSHDSTSWVLCTLGVFMFCSGLSARSEMRPIFVHICVSILLSSLLYGIVRLMPAFALIAVLTVIFYGYANYKAVEAKYSLMLDQMHSRRKLRELAERDMLTGLANRRLFEESLKDICKDDRPFAVLFIDLDKFKQVNDIHGHAVGDRLLKAVADRLRAAVPDVKDLIARLGGDEFAILQTGVTRSMPVEDLARRINQSLLKPFTLKDITVGIGCSIGIQLSSGQGRDPDHLLHAADEALYRVKEAGGGSYALA